MHSDPMYDGCIFLKKKCSNLHISSNFAAFKVI